MNIKAVSLNETLAKHFTDRGVAAQCLTYAVGTYVGKTLPLAQGQVESESIYFRNTCTPLVRERVSFLNELSVFDTLKAADVAKGIWMGRYHAVNPEPAHESGHGTFLESQFHLNKFFSPEDFAFMNEHATQINHLLIVVRELMKDAV